jgi:hypothetical protein
MKLRIIYTILGILLGVVIAYALTVFFFAFIGGLFWIFIFGDSPWPSWTGSLMITAGIVSFLGTLVGCGFYGYRYGLKTENSTDHPDVYQKAMSHLFVGVLVLIVAGGLFVYRWRLSSLFPNITKEQKLSDEISVTQKTITDVQINQIDKGIEIAVLIDGPTDDQYQLSLDLVGKKFIQESVFQDTQAIELKYKQQSFHFELPFEELAKQYRKILPAYVLNFDQKFSIDELFEAQLKLKIIETASHKAQEIAKRNIPPKEFSTLLRLSFLCSQDKCEISQKDKDELNPKQ